MFSVIKFKPRYLALSAIIMIADLAHGAEKSPAKSPAPTPTSPSALQVKATPAASTSAASTSAASTSASTEASCRRLVQKYGTFWQQLWQKRATDLRDEHTNGLSLISDMTPEYCSEEEPRKQVLALLARLANHHTGKIGVLLPLANKPLAKHILTGIEAAVRGVNMDPKSTLIVVDSQANPQRVEQLIAQLMFRDQVSALIGGFDASEVEVLKQWSTKLLVPTFILNEPTTANTKLPNAPLLFYSHPTEQGLAKALVAANEKYHHKKISIMRPNDQHADVLVRSYEQLAKAAGINILQSVVYDAKRFDQMESAARRLFKLEPNDRRDELKRLYEQAKDQAAATGQPFNAKMVALQPVVEQDAIFIADDFRTVRHMAKVFTYLGVRKIPMFGAYEWRSEGLIEPFDPLFTGSYFADFMGSYQTLPPDLRVPTTSSPYFIAPDRIEEVDFSTLGYRSALTPLALIKHPETPRRKLDRWIPRTTAKSNPKDITFDENNVISWPTYLFEVTSLGKTGALTMQPGGLK